MLKRAVSLFLAFCLFTLLFTGSAENECRNTDVRFIPFVLYSDVNPGNMHLNAEVPYGDSLFSGAATAYNHTLAQASLGLAFSNYRENSKDPEERGDAIKGYLESIGFTDLQADQYDVETSSETVASMIARKDITINGEPCTLVAVSICGAGYNNEWLSNFSFSEQEHHTGFDRAADKVLGRLLLYLFNHPTEDRVKLWISGYSRAGAIANLLGQKLSNGRLCAVEDLYVYTFASPNTAISDNSRSCPSIYNIVGSFDPFPTIPPTEWGYMRYGTTLFLPAQETDSDYALHRVAVDHIYRDLTGIKYWNNPICNWILQKLLQIVYSNISSAEVYSSLIKDVISGLWSEGSILSQVRFLSDTMNSDTDTDSSIRSLYASFREVLSPFLYTLFTQSGNEANRYWGNGVTLQTQILHEHSPEVYYAWMMSSDDPAELFLPSTSYYRISIPSGLQIDGIYRLEGEKELPAQDISVISFDISAMLNIPGDRPYSILLTADRDIESEDLIVNMYTLPSQEADVTIINLNMKKGETAGLLLPDAKDAGIVHFSYDPDSPEEPVSVIKGHTQGRDEKNAAILEYKQSGWLAKQLLDLLMWVPVVLLGLLAFCIIRINIRRKKHVFYARRAFLTLMIIFYFLNQFLRNYFPWGIAAIIICQGICSASGALISFFAWRQKKDMYTFLLFLAILFWTAGDVITKTNAPLGTAFFGAGHLILIFAFCIGRRPNRTHFMILIASAGLLFIAEVLTTADHLDLLRQMIYTVLILSMAVLSSLKGKAALAGGLLFVFADLLLTLKTVLNAPAWLFFLTLGAYYLSVAILSSSAYGETLPPTSEKHPEQTRIGSSEMKENGIGSVKPCKCSRHLFLLELIMAGLWIAVTVDCLVIGAREAVWLAAGMAASLLPPILIKKSVSRKAVVLLRNTAVVITSVLHTFVIGLIIFLMIFAGTHIATGSESDTVFLLGSDLTDNRPGLLYQSRIETAGLLMENQPDTTLLICGGITEGNTISEAEAARTVLTAVGAAPERILCEDRSTRTLDNFQYASAILGYSKDAEISEPVAVITNRFHFYRVSCLAREAGYQTVRLIPADGRLTVELPWILREVLTVTKFWFVGPN